MVPRWRVTCGDIVTEMGRSWAKNEQKWAKLEGVEWEEGVPKGREWFSQPGVRGALCDQGTAQPRTFPTPQGCSQILQRQSEQRELREPGRRELAGEKREERWGEKK